MGVEATLTIFNTGVLRTCPGVDRTQAYYRRQYDSRGHYNLVPTVETAAPSEPQLFLPNKGLWFNQ